jgi:predicted Rossmann fold nucleotide-binding protein DprA/Smf involved in DNA uptake
MTIRVGADARGHHRHVLKQTRVTGPTWNAGKESVKHVGIDRKPRERKAAELPLKERHEAILELVGDEPISAPAIARALDMKPSGVTSGLYALQDRGLVSRILYKGWIRAS